MKYARRSVLIFSTLVFLLIVPGQVAAKDVWTQVRSKNFLLVGNASEKEIRKVATRLEQFRETFRLLFTGINLTSSIPTNVVVFKSDSAFKNFKPKRSDGKIDNFVAGFFQPGEDVNYISLSAEGDGSGDATKYGVIFHEYVHFIVNTNFGKSDVPAWFNEGLAEYYETFAIEGDQKIKLGLPQEMHLQLLNQNKLMPLEMLFNTPNSALLESGSHSRSIFYAESWALMHYLIIGGKAPALNKFLALLLKNKPPEEAFKEAFQATYASMEAELRKYVSQTQYHFQQITLKEKLEFDSQMQASILDEADSNAYLGDLLYHNHREDDSEAFLSAALKLKPDSGMANTTLGMVKLRQRKFDEARKYLETAIASDPKNYIAYYRYAYILSHEGRDDTGFVNVYPGETADKMRKALKRAIELNPSFTESYELFAFVNLVNNENLDESLSALKTALRYQPGSQRYALRMAEILLRQDKFADASTIAAKIRQTADDPETKGRADSLLSAVARMKQFADDQLAERKRYESAVNTARTADSGSAPVDDPDVLVRSINEALRKPRTDEKRVIGSIRKIDCKARPLIFTVATPAETFAVSSADFESLSLNAFTPEANKAQIGCDENLSAFNAVITFRPKAGPKNAARGDLVAVEFVSKDFRFLDPLVDRAPSLSKRSGEVPTSSMAGTFMDPPPAKTPEMEEARRRSMMRSISDALRKPAEGQIRDIGFLDRIECGGKGAFFIIHTATKTLRLSNLVPQSLRVGVYVPELAGMQIGCAIKPIDIPAVFIYDGKSDAKMKSDGEILSLEFVPKGFALEP